MQKSKNFFIIMGITYLIITLLVFVDLLRVNMNFLLGLSTTSILISLSDICSSFINYIFVSNNTNLFMKFTHDYLSKKQSEVDVDSMSGIYSPVNTSNIIQKLEANYPKMDKAKKYNDIQNEWYIWVLSFIQKVFFILAIAIFLVLPLINVELIGYEKISMLITISAFAAICFSIYLSDKINEVNNKYTEFTNGTGLAIECKYKDYFAYITTQYQ